MNKRQIILYGAGPFGRMVLADMRRFGAEEAVAFTVDREFMTEEELDGLPVIPYDTIKKEYPPEAFDMLVSCNHRHMRARAGVYQKAKNDGYHLINYLSPGAMIDGDIKMGDNNIILPGAVIGGSGTMGSNNIIRQNLYLGHNFTVGSHSIISAGCTIGGYSKIGDLCYLGLSVTVADRKTIGDECLIGMGAIVTKDVPPFATAYGNPARVVSFHEDTGIMLD